MNYVRRSLGAMALTFCGMLSLHADLDTVVAPALDGGVTNAAQLDAALKLVSARALTEVAAGTELKLDQVKYHVEITAKINALKKASTDAQDADVRNAGFITAEIINIDAAVATFDAHIDALKVFNKSLPNEDFNSIVECIDAAKKVKPATMITVLKIAKYGTNDDVQKAKFLKRRDELKVNASADDILNSCQMSAQQYVAGFNQLLETIPNMSSAQAAHAHSFSLSQARIIARAGHEENIPGVVWNDFDARLLQAKTALKNRFHAANQELVTHLAEELTKKVLAKAAVKPGLMSTVWNLVPSIPKPSMPSFVSTGLNKLFSGSKNGGAVNYGVFTDISQTVSALVAPDATDAANAQAVVDFFNNLRTQAEAVQAIVAANGFDFATQTEALNATVALIEQKYRECFADADAVTAFVQLHNANKLTKLRIKAACGPIQTAIAACVDNQELDEFLGNVYQIIHQSIN